MKIKYTKKQRDDAALACAVAASHDAFGLYGALEALDVTGPAYSLAVSAANVALHQRGNYCSEDYRAACAEAEAMLRTGWLPS